MLNVLTFTIKLLLCIYIVKSKFLKVAIKIHYKGNNINIKK